MNTLLKEITDKALALEANDRLALARQLLDSVEGASPLYDEETHAELLRRDDEMSRGVVKGVPRDEVMHRLRTKFPCE